MQPNEIIQPPNEATPFGQRFRHDQLESVFELVLGDGQFRFLEVFLQLFEQGFVDLDPTRRSLLRFGDVPAVLVDRADDEGF